MSQDRDISERGTPGPALVKKQPKGRYTPLYMGRQRKPERPDEAGAVAVVELVFGGRVVLYPYDNDHVKVERRD